MTGTALADAPVSFQPAVLSSPWATDNEDEETLFGHVCPSLPAQAEHEPTRAPAYPVSMLLEEETEEGEALLASPDTCNLQSSSIASNDDRESSALDLATEQVDELMAIAEGTKCSAHATLVLPAVWS
jgi:hypothetical protein